MKLTNLPIGLRLSLGFGLLLVLMIIGNGAAVIQFTTVGEVNSRIIEQDWVKVEAANTIEVVAQSNAKRILELLVTTRPEQQAQIKEAIAKNKKSIDDALHTLEQLVRLQAMKQSRHSPPNLFNNRPYERPGYDSYVQNRAAVFDGISRMNRRVGASR